MLFFIKQIFSQKNLFLCQGDGGIDICQFLRPPDIKKSLNCLQIKVHNACIIAFIFGCQVSKIVLFVKRQSRTISIHGYKTTACVVSFVRIHHSDGINYVSPNAKT